MSTQLFSLEGRTALITGSARGLGQGIAAGMAAAGARVVLNGTDAARSRISQSRGCSSRA